MCRMPWRVRKSANSQRMHWGSLSLLRHTGTSELAKNLLKWRIEGATVVFSTWEDDWPSWEPVCYDKEGLLCHVEIVSRDRFKRMRWFVIVVVPILLLAGKQGLSGMFVAWDYNIGDVEVYAKPEDCLFCMALGGFRSMVAVVQTPKHCIAERCREDNT